MHLVVCCNRCAASYLGFLRIKPNQLSWPVPCFGLNRSCNPFLRKLNEDYCDDSIGNCSRASNLGAARGREYAHPPTTEEGQEAAIQEGHARPADADEGHVR